MKLFLYPFGLLCGLVIGTFVSGKIGVIFIIALAVLLAGSVGLMFYVYAKRITNMVNPFYLNRVYKYWYDRINSAKEGSGTHGGGA